MSAEGFRSRIGAVRAAARVWLRDIWRDGWDAERRALLFRHYWSYVRHPPIPTEHLPAGDERATHDAAQERFAQEFRSRIEWSQACPAPPRWTYLTYRPIGKNLRLLGTAVRASARSGVPTAIRPGGPPTEELALAQKGHDWSPWLWGRGPEPPDASASARRDSARAWNRWFRHPSPPSPVNVGSAPPTVHSLRSGSGPFSAAELQRVLELAVATRYVFEPVGEIVHEARRLRARMEWPDDEAVLGIHVRRGDAASPTDGTTAPAKSTRASFSLASYLEAADRLCECYGIRHIFLGTESMREIERAAALRPQYRFLFLDYDRTVFPDISSSRLFIEDLALEQPERVPSLTKSAVLDLYFFCECQAFVGAFNSEFSVLSWLLACGSRGHAVPYISLSQPLPRRDLNPFTALLNVRNNCPLELFHW